MTPYAYRPGNSLIHKAPALIKLLLLFAVSFSAFFGGFPGLAAASILIISGALIARINPWELMYGSKALLIMAAAVILIRSLHFDQTGFFFSREGFILGIQFSWGMVVSFSSAALLFSTSTLGEIRDSLTQVEKIVLWPVYFLSGSLKNKTGSVQKKQMVQPKLALGISLMLGFIPRFFEIWENTRMAYEARSGKKGFREIITLLPLVCERMIVAAAETAEAMDSRGIL